MPTGARLFSGVALAILAFIVSGQVMPLMPEGTDFGYFTLINMGVGLVVGWVVMGPRTGRGFAAGLTNGLTGMLSMVFCCLFIYGMIKMFDRAMDRRYDGPFEAVIAIFELAVKYATDILVPNVLITLLVGGICAGFAGEFAAKRFR